MEKTSSTMDSINWDLSFDANHPSICYGIKVFRQLDEVHVTKMRKSIAKFKMSDFPDEIDFSDVESFGTLIEIVREHGCVGLANRLGIEPIKDT